MAFHRFTLTLALLLPSACSSGPGDTTVVASTDVEPMTGGGTTAASDAPTTDTPRKCGEYCGEATGAYCNNGQCG